MPLAIAGVTTVLGSATLTWSPIPAIRDLGIYSLIGISAVSFLALTILPAALLVLPDAPLVKPHGHRIIGPLEKLGKFAIENRGAVLIGTVLLSALSGWAALSLRVETDYVGFFDPEGEVRRDAVAGGSDRADGTDGPVRPVKLRFERRTSCRQSDSTP